MFAQISHQVCAAFEIKLKLKTEENSFIFERVYHFEIEIEISVYFLLFYLKFLIYFLSPPSTIFIYLFIYFLEVCCLLAHNDVRKSFKMHEK